MLLSTTIIIFGFLALVPAYAAIDFSFPCPPSGAGLGDCPDPSTSIPNYIIRFYQFGVGIAGILAVGMIVVGAITISLSGAIDKQKEGKDMIKSAIWGIALLLGSYLILNTVNPELTKLKDPNIPILPQCIEESGRYINEPCVPKPYQFETLSFEKELPPLSSSTDVTDFCRQIAPGNSSCLRGDCHIALGIRIGCDGYQPLGSQFPLKSGICRWAGQTRGESYCVLRQQTVGALMLFNQRAQDPQAGFRYEITEAYPPTSVHSLQGGHYQGCSIDIAPRKPNGGKFDPTKPTEREALCLAVQKALTAAEESGFSASNEYSECEGTQSERATGGHIHLKAENCP